MRINQYVARASGVSRRRADELIKSGVISINGSIASLGETVGPTDTVVMNGKRLGPQQETTILLNKPVGYVCSRVGQGSKTIYDLLPKNLYHLKPVGRLDKDSSGLLLLTSDGRFANQLTHPRYSKQKKYQITLDKRLSAKDKQLIESGIELNDGVSRLKLKGKGTHWTVNMSEGRNRQIRRTFKAAGYNVVKLHRVSIDNLNLDGLKEGGWRFVK